MYILPHKKLQKIQNRVMQGQEGQWHINNLREKFSPAPGFEPGPPAQCAGALTS